ncbi:MAG: hypothetical protein AAF623_11075 [Planctomycetota bacterium]
MVFPNWLDCFESCSFDSNLESRLAGKGFAVELVVFTRLFSTADSATDVDFTILVADPVDPFLADVVVPINVS